MMICSGARYLTLKRCIDVVGSLFCLCVFLPFFVAIAIWVKLDSSGPIFYRQIRVTKGGRHFKALKFRSMTVLADGDTSKDGVTTPDKMNRITKSGRFIRKYRLDELAQLWNVFIGDMSLVGPRPQTVKYVEIYPETYEKINVIRPGITGLASIKIHESEERVLAAKGDKAEDYFINVLLPRKFKYNLFYVHHYGLWFDLKIIWWTAVGMVRKA